MCGSKSFLNFFKFCITFGVVNWFMFQVCYSVQNGHLSNKRNSFPRLFLIVFIFFCFSTRTAAQNLFANSDFEQLNNCTEYHQDCASEAWFYIKPSATPLFTPNIIPKPFNGKDLLILPIENVYDHQKKRQFVYTMLTCSLQKGKKYNLTFYINTSANTFYGMDFYFQKSEFTSSNFSADSIIPSIHISKDDIHNELDGWNYLEKTYTATGEEKFCLLGNLSKEKFDFFTYQRMNKGGDVFYFIDDIVFKPEIPQPICADYKFNVDQLYKQNKRHTEHVLVNNTEEIITDTITVPSVFFETDKSILKPIFKKLLDSLLLKLVDKKVKQITIEGHTDSKGTDQQNNVLSTQRAEAVRLYFVNNRPDIKENIFAYGKASIHPVADNATEKGRAQNRRVEIILVYTNPTKENFMINSTSLN